jgi:hypothetical protein
VSRSTKESGVRDIVRTVFRIDGESVHILRASWDEHDALQGWRSF